MENTFRFGAVIVFIFVLGLTLRSPCAQGETLRADITTQAGDKARFIEGSGISFFVSLNQRAYVALVLEDEFNHRTPFYPEQAIPASMQDAGDYLPLANLTKTLRVSSPFGRETVTMLVSDRPLPPLPVTAHGALRSLSWSNEQWHAWLRAYPSQCGCQFVLDQVSFITFADNNDPQVNDESP